MGPQVRAAMVQLCKSGRAEVLIDLVERAPNESAAAPVWEFLAGERILESLLEQPRVNLALVSRLARRKGASAAPALVSAAITFADAKTRIQLFDLIHSLGDDAGPAVAERIAAAPPLLQRELLGLLGRMTTLPSGFSAHDYLVQGEPLVRREAVKLLLRDPSSREDTIMRALADADDRVVFVGLTAAQDGCPQDGFALIRERVDASELDSQLRTMGIRIIAQQRTPETLSWLLSQVVAEGRWPRRLRLRPSSPEMLAALSVIASGWRDDPAADAALKLADQSNVEEIRMKLSRARGPSPDSVARR